MSAASKAGEGKGWRQNVAAIIMDAEGNVLVGRKSDKSPYWHFPQGGVRPKESLEEAMRREIGEETGLPGDACCVRMRLGGLRYRYRLKNRKSCQWEGQEQTYFLMSYGSVKPQADASCSPEFSCLRWLPLGELQPGLFVPFKRKVVEQVLNILFPAGVRDWEKRISSLSAGEPYLYLPEAGLARHDPADLTYFAGGKSEMQMQMQDLARCLDRAHRRAGDGLRMLVLIWGLHGSGRAHCLRRLAPCLDPLQARLQTLREAAAAESLPFVDRLGMLIPAPGEIRLLHESPYDLLLRGMLSTEGKEEAMGQAAALASFEAMLQAQGIRLLKFHLHISRQEQAERLGAETPSREWCTTQAAIGQLMGATSHAVPWHIIPSDRRWYRDYIIGRFMAKAIGSQSTQCQQIFFSTSG